MRTINYSKHRAVRDRARSIGAPRYFDGDPCMYGHLSERSTNNGQCIECRRERARRPDLRAINRRHLRQYRQNHLEQCRERDKGYYYKHHEQKLQALQRSNTQKIATSLNLVGCSAAQLFHHIERQFVKGMTWENRHLWHIDHIRPCAQFDLTDPAQQRACFHFTNLRPLWKKQNLEKRACRLFLI